MLKFKVPKTSNDIEDSCITYGIIALLEHVNAEIQIIKDNPSHYLIECEDFNLEKVNKKDFKLTLDDMKSTTPLLNKKNIENNIQAIYKLIKERGSDILNYYLTEDKSYIKGLNNDSVGFCGNVFFMTGLRLNATVSSFKTPKHQKYLSLIGWSKYVSKLQIIKKNSPINDKNTEHYIYLIPKIKEVEQIDKIVLWTKDRETGLNKELNFISDESVNTALAKVLLSNIEHEITSDGYNGFYSVVLIPSNQKTIPNTFKTINFLDELLSNDLIEWFSRKLYNIDIKEYAAKFILDMSNYSKLSSFIKIMSKKDYYEKNGEIKMGYIPQKIIKELLSMQSDKVIEIYNNKSIKRLGQGLNRLLKDDKGYEVQVNILSTNNLEQLMKGITKLCTLYRRYYSEENKIKSLINDEQIDKIFKLIDSNKDAKVVADAILFNSKIFLGENNADNKVKDEIDN